MQQASSDSARATGMAIMLGAMLILPGMDAIAKYMAVSAGMSPAQVTFYRFFFQLVATLPMLVRLGGLRALTPERPWFNLLRGVLLAAAALLFFTAVKYMPLADVFAIYFVEPFMLTCLSALILGERVGWPRWVAIAVGFGGAMIVIQPSFQAFGLTALLPVGCAFLFACYLLMNRASGPADTPLAMQTFAGIGGTLFMGATILLGHGAALPDFAPSLPQTPLGWLLVMTLGTLSGYGHLMVVKAFRAAPRLAARTVPLFRDRQRDRARLPGVRRVSHRLEMARCRDHRRVRPVHDLAGTPRGAGTERALIAASAGFAIEPRRAEDLLEGAAQLHVDLRHGDEQAEIGKAGDAIAPDAAGNDPVEMVEFRIDVQRQAMETHPAPQADADRRDLVLRG